MGDEMQAQGSPLFAVIEGKAVLYQVVGWDGTVPHWVPVGRYVREGNDVGYRPVPVQEGLRDTPGYLDRVIYALDVESLVDVFVPWLEVDSDDQ